MRERERAEAGLLVRETEVGREREKEPAMGGRGERRRRGYIERRGKQDHTMGVLDAGVRE